MFVYSLHSKRCIEITDSQHSFLEKVAQVHGDIDKATLELLVSQEVLDSWKSDENFWPMVTALSRQLATSRILTLEYLKDQLVSTIDGSKQPTKMQMQAINASVKILNLGAVGIRSTKVEITPESFKVSFDEGVISTTPEADQPPQDTPGDANI